MSSPSPDIDAFRAAALRCPLPQAIELIGEKWAFLILRGALNGLQHFEQFQAGLGIARNILSNRLARIVEGGILARTADQLDGRKVVYALTAKGEALLPVVIALQSVGRGLGPRDAGHSCSPTSATENRCARSASSPRTAASSTSTI